MFRKLHHIFLSFYYSFPVQLFIISLKRHQFLLVLWIVFFVVIIGRFAADFGVPYLFLDPEYLENVGYLSFAITGVGFGVMFVTWNMVSYMLNSHRFPFLASLNNPLGVYFLNNLALPFLFIVSYCYAIVRFQNNYQFKTEWQIFFQLLGFLAGFAWVLLVAAIYFQITNKNAKTLAQQYGQGTIRSRGYFRRQELWNDDLNPAAKMRVDNFVTSQLLVRRTHDVEHYENALRRLVFRRHHLNSLFVQILVLLVMISFGFYMDNPFFQIPAASSAFLLAALLMSLFGVLIYWTGGWGTTAIFLFLLGLNQITKFDVFGHQNKVYGLNYETTKADYSYERFAAIASKQNIERDKRYFEKILLNWKKKNTNLQQPNYKPKLVFVNVSGGGLRAAMFATAVLQTADSALKGKLFDKTFLISGASGGMLGAALMRELFLEKKNGLPINLYNRDYAYDIAKDLLNPMCVCMLSNDMLLPVHSFKVNGYAYKKDRGYMFEKFLSKNTGGLLDKTISDYREPEMNAKIPLMIFHTVIMNDSRRYYISPHPVSFLMRPFSRKWNDFYMTDAIDFGEFFKAQDAEHLSLTSALRMSATFPIMLPNPVLPSKPETFVMDGGALDNFGSETTFRFLQSFKTWIRENTGGVVVIQIRDESKQKDIAEIKRKSLFTRLSEPLGTVFVNMENMQDFFTDQKLNEMNEDLNGKLDFVLFEYKAEKKEDKAAMSLHLTTREKEDIIRTISRENNILAFEKLQRLLAD